MSFVIAVSVDSDLIGGSTISSIGSPQKGHWTVTGSMTRMSTEDTANLSESHRQSREVTCGNYTGPVPYFISVVMPQVDRRTETIGASGRPSGMTTKTTKLDLLQGTLDLMVLRTLAAMGPQHGYGIARRIEQVSGNEVLLNQGTIYASLVRLQQRRLIRAEWGTSENNRRARYYSLTRSGRKQLESRAAEWERITAVMQRVLGQSGKGGGE
jgi:transcriptional regulator